MGLCPDAVHGAEICQAGATLEWLGVVWRKRGRVNSLLVHRSLFSKSKQNSSGIRTV